VAQGHGLLGEPGAEVAKVQVGAADAGRNNFYQQVFGADFRSGYFIQSKIEWRIENGYSHFDNLPGGGFYGCNSGRVLSITKVRSDPQMPQGTQFIQSDIVYS
jgi:hypothetical protein